MRSFDSHSTVAATEALLLREVRRRLIATLAGIGLCLPQLAATQTFVQLSDLGENVGPRLTSTVTQARIQRMLFGRIGTKVSFIANGVVYQLATDPEWGRVTTGRWDKWIRPFTNLGGPGGRLGEVQGIDISARRTVYIADRSRARVLRATFDTASGNLVNPSSPPWQLARPVDVAWDGASSPLTTDFLYVLDESTATVSFWDLNPGVPSAPIWTYGAPGPDAGQFSHPSGVCAGKTAAPTGGTQFTSSFYVVDHGNRRVIWLNRGQNGPTWVGAASLPGWDPTDCAVDHFGNLYVVDASNHRLYKFTQALALLASYGSYGIGPSNYGTFAYPHAVSVPCGVRIAAGQPVWYCEGRLVTGEAWSDSSGAVEHYLNFEFSLTAGPDTSTKVASIAYRTTDHTRQWVRVLDWNGAFVRTLANGTLMPPGTIGWLWDGRRNDGTWTSPGNYRFRIDVESAYGCGYSWCHTTTFTSTFWSNGNTNCGPPPPPAAPPAAIGPIGRQACIARDLETEPTTLFLRQRILLSAQPLTRVSGLGASAPAEAATTASGSLTDLVRQYGVRGLSFSVTPAAAASPLTLRVYSLAGRAIRALVSEQLLSSGFYEVAWDGLDDRGQRAAPGVYFAVLTAGGQRIVQRLILRETP
jgi:flagellar hook assembly protein FlgD